MGMAQDVSVIVRDDDRARLEAIVGDRNQRQKHMQRARIVLLSADRCRWQRWPGKPASVGRRCGAGSTGSPSKAWCLLRDKTRPPGTPLPDETVARVVAMTCAEPPGEATHWTGRALAKEAGISLQFGAADLGRA